MDCPKMTWRIHLIHGHFWKHDPKITLILEIDPSSWSMAGKPKKNLHDPYLQVEKLDQVFFQNWTAVSPRLDLQRTPLVPRSRLGQDMLTVTILASGIQWSIVRWLTPCQLKKKHKKLLVDEFNLWKCLKNCSNQFFKTFPCLMAPHTFHGFHTFHPNCYRCNLWLMLWISTYVA